MTLVSHWSVSASANPGRSECNVVFRDAIDTIVDSAFSLAMRADVVVWMVEPVDDAARHALAAHRCRSPLPHISAHIKEAINTGLRATHKNMPRAT
jgi:hypothetical protein